MQIYLDTANLTEIKRGARLGVVSGATTNPSLMAKETGADYRATVQEICHLLQGPVSAEVVALDAEKMVEEGSQIALWSPLVVVKVPLTEEGLAAIHQLSRTRVDPDRMCEGCAHREECPVYARRHEIVESRPGIPVNCTLIFSSNQALLAARAGAAYVSPFVGRLDDVGHDGMELVADVVAIFARHDLGTEVIAASLRHPMHITEAARAGAQIGTMPFKVLMQAIQHPLTDVGIERFLADWRASGRAI